MANGNPKEERDFYDDFRKIPFSVLPKPPADLVLERKLLEAMRAPRPEDGGSEPPTNDKIPAGFTYLGQFITHDISPTKEIGFEARETFVPRFHLDTLYGTGPDGGDRRLYVRDWGDVPKSMAELLLNKFERKETSSEDEIEVIKDNIVRCFKGVLMKLNTYGKDVHDVDRENKEEKGEALSKMGNDRNDRNYPVLQMYCAFIRFHNAVAVHLNEHNHALVNNKLFKETKKIVTWHYQWLVVHQYLAMLTGQDLVHKLLKGEEQFRLFKLNLKQKETHLMPEFSGAAFRIGHSQVREIYIFPQKKPSRFNDHLRRPLFLSSKRDAYFDQLLSMNREKKIPDLQERRDLRGEIKRDAAELSMNWEFFFDFGPESKYIPQASLAIDHNIIAPLFDLFFFARDKNEPSLPKRDFKNSRLLPAGYALHLACALAYPNEEEFTKDKLTNEQVRQTMGIEELRVEDLPLLLYLLLEAEIKCEGKQLGPLGSRIIAEQIIWTILADEDSFVYQKREDGSPWEPDKKFTEWRQERPLVNDKTSSLPYEAQKFSIVDMLKFTASFHQ